MRLFENIAHALTGYLSRVVLSRKTQKLPWPRTTWSRSVLKALIGLILLPTNSCSLLSKATMGSLPNETIGKIAQFFAAPLVDPAVVELDQIPNVREPHMMAIEWPIEQGLGGSIGFLLIPCTGPGPRRAVELAIDRHRSPD